MTSIYRIALGDEFERLHPKMQHRFGFSSSDGVAQIGAGVMDEVWRGPWWTLPFLMVGSTRRVLFPSKGKNIPFTVSNYAYLDSFGRETVTWSRRFKMKNRYRAFDATMIYSADRRIIIDYLGTHQHLAVEIKCHVDDDGAMCLESGDYRFYERFLGFRLPQWSVGKAIVREWWDDHAQRYAIDVNVTNDKFGPLFGYRGWFDVTERKCGPHEIPLEVKPLREERRD